eukprot:244522_1
MGNIQERYTKRTIHDLSSTRPARKIVIKTLILGSGGVGKTTVYKCIKLACKDMNGCNQYPTDIDLRDTQQMSRQNAVQGIATLLKASDFTSTSIITQMSVQKIQAFKTCTFEEQLLPLPLHGSHGLNYASLQTLGQAIDTVWTLNEVQHAFNQRMRKRFAFPDNMDYFYNKIQHVMSESYVPSMDDCLRVRIRTTGLMVSQYTDRNGITFEFRDVGGERNERKKWIHSFSNVNCLLFVCSLNQYCLSLFEDENTIGLIENYLLWEQIATSKWFQQNTTFILLLNKTDLFREFLMSTPLTFCFGDEYKGRNYHDIHPDKIHVIQRLIMEIMMDDVEHELILDTDVSSVIGMYYCEDLRYSYWLDLVYKDGVEFIKQKYLSVRSDVLVYEVSAIDPKQIKVVVDEIRDRWST